MTFTATLSGSNTTISVTPYGYTGLVTYQWEQSSNGLDGWTILSTEQTSSITYTGYVGKYLRPLATDNNNALSDIAVIHVYSDSGNTRIEITTGNNVTSIGSTAFIGCTNLTSVSMPAVTTIVQGAFLDCTNLTTVSMPAVTSIGDRAFQFCRNLTSVSMPLVTTIGGQAFNGCNLLTTFTIGEYFSSITNIISSTVTSIRALNTSTTLFNDSNGLLYKKLTSGTPGTASVVFCPRTLTSNLTLDTVTSNASGTDVTYTITEIGETAFKDCTGLTSVSMPSVITIGDYAFYNCTDLTSVSMPLVTTIGDYAFYNCTDLTSVYMPLVQTIVEGAFDSCTSLGNVVIGSSLTNMGGGAFANCGATLTHMYFLGDKPTIGMSTSSDDSFLFNGATNLKLYYFDSNNTWPTSGDTIMTTAWGTAIKAYKIPKITTSATVAGTISGTYDTSLSSVEVYLSTDRSTWTTKTATLSSSGGTWSIDTTTLTSGATYYVSTIYNYYDATNYGNYCKTVSIPSSNICFPAGTPVFTNQGYIPIEQIDPSIHTVRNKPIVAITQTVSDETHLIRIAKHALGNNYPSKTTLITQNHQVMFMGSMIKAKDLVELVDRVTQVPYKGEPLYNVLLETHDKMQVNNLIVETLHPEHKIAKLYQLLNMVKPEERDQMIALYNHLERQHKIKNQLHP